MKKMYLGYALLYLVISIVEFIFYLSFNSTTFGLIYIIFNLIVTLLIIFTSINYRNKNVNLRISKNLFLIFLILFSILILPKFNYVDESEAFINNMNIFVCITKPILILIFMCISILDFKFNNKSNYKIN